MIDHVSVAVSDLAVSRRFYESALATLGFEPLRERETTVGFGKHHPEFWINARPGMAPVAGESGVHVCLRAASPEMVAAFHEAALAAGSADDGPPGMRPEYNDAYYAAFVRDPDGNRIEVVTFLEGG